MEYFSQFPKMLYDIKGNNNVKVVPDIFRRIKIVNKIKHRTQSNWCVEQHKKPDNADWNAHRF